MSLREELREALNDVVPAHPTPGMRERVMQTTLGDKRRRRKERMVYRMRFPLALVAAVLLVAVAVAAIVTWNSLHNNMAPAGQVPQVTVQQLEARAVVLPKIGPSDACPQNTGTNPYGYALGSGPVYADGSNPITTAWGNYFDIPYFTKAGLTGLVLIRGRDLRPPYWQVVFVGTYAAGPVVGTDPARQGGVQHGEAVLDASHPPRRLNNQGVWTVRQGLPTTASSCFGFQFDGADFSERLTGGT